MGTDGKAIRTARRCARITAFAAVLGLVGGCTVVQVQSGGQVQTQVLPGFAQVVIAGTSENGVAIRTTGVGFVIGPRSISIGWIRELATELPAADGCRLVLLEPDARSVAAVLSALRAAGADASSLCNVQMKGD
jgi:hypothetical protein